ncbi:MAG: hypothetical protein ACKO8N_09920 [Rubrivivax sp.]
MSRHACRRPGVESGILSGHTIAQDAVANARVKGLWKVMPVFVSDAAAMSGR